MDGTEGSQIFIDETGKTVSVNGDAKITTSDYKFPTGSGYFDGSGDYLSIGTSSDWDFGGDDWTIDFWVKYPSIQHNVATFFLGNIDDRGISLWTMTNKGNKFQIDLTSDQNNRYIDDLVTATANTWQHIAIVRSGSNVYFFVNGTLSKTLNVGSDTFNLGSYNFLIGSGTTSGYYTNCYVDEFRVSKGIARWTSDFTPPSSPYEYDIKYEEVTTLTNGQANTFDACTNALYKIKIEGTTGLKYLGGAVYFK